ncbi:MAG: MBOAT family protein, partial [Bdellovibrionales bacterium]|nr:MBOAT family protein [Bdellovibrionales bacterium]
LMGFNLPDNFLRPYVASSFSDFWKRWHISLSTWLRDYLYIPLGGNQMKTKLGVYRNLMLTMLLGGLWHGAAWNFVIWGFLHGSYLVLEKLFNTQEIRAGISLRKICKIIIIFHLVLFTWIAFRAETLVDMSAILNAMFNPFFESNSAAAASHSITKGMIIAWAVIALGWLSQIIAEFWNYQTRFLALPIPIKVAVYSLISAAVCIMGSGASRPFIYFKF